MEPLVSEKLSDESPSSPSVANLNALRFKEYAAQCGYIFDISITYKDRIPSINIRHYGAQDGNQIYMDVKKLLNNLNVADLLTTTKTARGVQIEGPIESADFTKVLEEKTVVIKPFVPKNRAPNQGRHPHKEPRR